MPVDKKNAMEKHTKMIDFVDQIGLCQMSWLCRGGSLHLGVLQELGVNVPRLPHTAPPQVHSQVEVSDERPQPDVVADVVAVSWPRDSFH